MTDLPSPDHSLAAYQYTLPPGQIAQAPVTPRDASRLLVVQGADQHQHRHFYHLPELLNPGDLLVVNNTRVIPARLMGQKPSGGTVEVLLLEPRATDQWLALVRPGRRLKPGAVIQFGPPDQPADLWAEVIDQDPDTSGRVVQFYTRGNQPLYPLLERLGQVPLPPYITGSPDPDRYQTIYAEVPGAVAAPTAGLHFTERLFEALSQRGVNHCYLTLHVGVGTFRPIATDNVLDHTMHGEWVEVPTSTVDLIKATQARGNRVIAVGTTVVRALEGAAQAGQLQPWQGQVNLYIYPGYRFRVIDGLITNFHLPGSSLLLLVSALIGRQRLLDLYQKAIQAGYRFYSFGDAMVILPEATAPQCQTPQTESP
jgi:S-adenosylmethionine:tRNA ribosyltransferase-isomerase